MDFVYVVPRDLLFPARLPQGFLPFRGRAPQDQPSATGSAAGSSGGSAAGTSLEAHLETPEAFHGFVHTHGFFVERDRAERTPAWKQVIPYTLVLSESRVLLVQRKRAGTESRLHDKLSIGIGGHVEPVDSELAATRGESNPIAAGSRRELEEELEFQGPPRLRTLGLLNDDANPVGAVHLGLVQVAEVEGPVRVREEDILAGRLVAPDELETLLRDGANFESWSAILVERLSALLPISLTTT